MTGGHPFDWHLPLVGLVAVAALVAAFTWATRRPGYGATAHQRRCFWGGALVLLVAVAWPLGDLAAHWSLLALVVQRLLLLLAAPPLLVAGTPPALLIRLTRPAPVDALLRVAVKPVLAVAIVTVIAVGTLTTGAVSLSTRSEVARAAVQLLVLGAGFVLWAPILDALPGAPRLSALGRAGYLIVQSIVPSFLCIVWIFARRPLYPAYTHQGTVLGMTSLLDQQLAGFLAKLSTIAVLWTVAYVIVSRAQVFSGAEEEPGTLVWSDVEREIERADRRDRRQPGLGPASPDDGRPE
jgi:cytochrome c oxidase assembly factor CtaG